MIVIFIWPTVIHVGTQPNECEELLKFMQRFYISLVCLGFNVHNKLKIQEETEMWKMRDWEIQKSHPKNMSGMENER